VALQWVSQSIGAFGGDPRRVAIARQSAGALAVIDLLAAPAASTAVQRCKRCAAQRETRRQARI